MKTVTYWLAKRLDDDACYSIRARTRKEVMQQLDGFKRGEYEGEDAHVNGDIAYAVPVKVSVEYTSVIGLVALILGEGWSEEFYAFGAR